MNFTLFQKAVKKFGKTGKLNFAGIERQAQPTRSAGFAH
jgi:hypothetical protein